MLAKTIPTESATVIAAMTRVRRLRNLRAIVSKSLPRVSGCWRLINDVQRNRLIISTFLFVYGRRGLPSWEVGLHDEFFFGAPAGD